MSPIPQGAIKTVYCFSWQMLESTYFNIFIFFCSQWFWDLFQSIKDGTVRFIFCSLYFKHKYLISLHQVLMMLHSVLSTLITNRGNFALFFVCTYDIAPLLRLKGWGQRCKHNLPCLYDHFILSL